MSRILLVDDSPHAQRIGERILSEEGYEVVTVSNADSALIRLEDVDPDLVLADTVMPGRTGYELCQYLKMSPRHQRVRVILTAGVLEDFDAELLKRVQADATLKKPFEASALLAAVKPLAEAAEKERDQGSGRASSSRGRGPVRRGGGCGTGAGGSDAGIGRGHGSDSERSDGAGADGAREYLAGGERGGRGLDRGGAGCIRGFAGEAVCLTKRSPSGTGGARAWGTDAGAGNGPASQYDSRSSSLDSRS